MKLRTGDIIFLVWGGFLFTSWLFFPSDLGNFIVGFFVFVILPWYVYSWLSKRKQKKQKNALQHN